MAKRKCDKEAREGPELSDSYIKKLLCAGTALRHADIPDELVALKRAHLKMGRLLKEKKR